MSPFLLWLRRGTAPLLFVTLTLLLAITLRRDHDWTVDAAWGARYAGVLTRMAAPVMAAAVAYDYACRFRPTLADLARSGRRRTSACVLPATSALVGGLAAVAVAVAGVLVTVGRNGGLMQVDQWFVPELILALAAVVAIGAAVGSVVDGLVAPVVAALVVLLTPLLLSFLSTDLANSLFNPAYTPGTQLGLERHPGAAMAAMATHLLIVVVGVLITWDATWPMPRGVLVGAAAILVAALTVQALTFPAGGTFRASRERTTCVGSPVAVCGPDRAQHLFVQAQRDMNHAVRHLQSSGLELPRTFVYGRPGTNGWSATTTKLVFDLESLRNGNLPRSTVVQSLTAPRACVGFFTEEDYTETTRRTELVSAWIDSALARPAAGVAPADVRQAYHELLTCRTMPGT